MQKNNQKIYYFYHRFISFFKQIHLSSFFGRSTYLINNLSKSLMLAINIKLLNSLINNKDKTSKFTIQVTCKNSDLYFVPLRLLLFSVQKKLISSLMFFLKTYLW